MSKVDDMFFENTSRVSDRIEDMNKELLSKVKLNVPYIQELITDFSDFSVTVIDRTINNQDGLKEFYTPLMADYITFEFFHDSFYDEPACSIILKDYVKHNAGLSDVIVTFSLGEGSCAVTLGEDVGFVEVGNYPLPASFERLSRGYLGFPENMIVEKVTISAGVLTAYKSHYAKSGYSFKLKDYK